MVDLAVVAFAVAVVAGWLALRPHVTLWHRGTQEARDIAWARHHRCTR